MEHVDFSELENEVKRRVDNVLSDPERSKRYDLNNDGVIDDEEKEKLRRIVAAEVFGEFSRRFSGGSPPVPDTAIGGRFKILEDLGSGGQGHTYLAEDSSTGEHVALKELAVGRINDWKALELFDREAEVLKALEHPGIPKHIDAFHIDTDAGRRFFLVQELVDGHDLEKILQSTGPWKERVVIQMALEVTNILRYLHQLSPPVIHRDLKPSNIIRRENGTFALIDFGAVQNVVPKTVGGSTIAGTPGYMPIEQIMGRSVPATDFYALGATMIHLLSAVHPADLPIVRSRMQFEQHVNASPSLAKLLGEMVEPAVEDRPKDVDEVFRRLAQPPAPVQALMNRPPGQKKLNRMLQRSNESTFLKASQQGLVQHAQEIMKIIDADPPFNIKKQPVQQGMSWRFGQSKFHLVKSSNEVLAVHLSYEDFYTKYVFLFGLVAVIGGVVSSLGMITAIGVGCIFLAIVWFFIGAGAAGSTLRIPAHGDLTISDKQGGVEPIPRKIVNRFDSIHVNQAHNSVRMICSNGDERLITSEVDSTQADYIAAFLNRALLEQKR